MSDSDRRTTAQPLMARAFHEVRELIAEAKEPSEVEVYIPSMWEGYLQALKDLDEDLVKLLERSKLPDYVTKPCCTEGEHEALAAYRELAVRAAAMADEGEADQLAWLALALARVEER